MNKTTGMIFAAWAMGGFALTWGLVSAGRLDAVSPDAPPIGNVSLTPTPIDGVEMVLAAAGMDPGRSRIMVPANSSPKVELHLKNTTPESADVEADVAVSVAPGANFLSRVPPRLNQVWQQHESLSLAPMESRTITLDTPQVSLQPGGRLVASLKSGDEAVMPVEFFVQPLTPAQLRATLKTSTTRKAQ